MAIQNVPAYQVVCDTCALPAPAGMDAATAKANATGNGYKSMTTTSGPATGQTYTYCPSCSSLLKGM